jgi:DNA-binding MarR family transcriptional regulator
MPSGLLIDRVEAIDEIATNLVPRASQLTRLLLSRGSRALTRAEGSLLRTLTGGPHSITELPTTEVLAQPTVTQLVDRLEKRGLVERARDAGDRRVVLVSITVEGRETLDALRAEYRAVLRQAAGDLPEEELAALLRATGTLQRLIDAVQETRP